MQTIYWAHSYRDEDAYLNRHVGNLLDAEGIAVNFDPPSDRVNAAKLERNLRACDGMVATLSWRDGGASPYILYEISMCLRAHKPLLVYIDHRLPGVPIPGRVLQRRYSHTTYIQQIRDQQHALRLLKDYIGDAPPPRYQPTAEQRSCGIVGRSALTPAQRNKLDDQLGARGFEPIDLESLDLSDPFLFDAHERIGGLELAVSCVDSEEPSAYYLRGALAAEAVPTIAFSADKRFTLTPSYPASLQSRVVEVPGQPSLDEMLSEEIALFDELFLENVDADAIDRYTKTQLQAGYRHGRYESDTRSEFMKIVMGDERMGDTYNVSGQAGAVGPNAHVHDVNFTQTWQQMQSSVDTSQLANELATLRAELERQGTEPAQKMAAGAVAAAEASARQNDGPKALEYLSSAGKWALDVAEKIGVAVATAAIRAALGV
jgi:hypothetical protein